jgi:hypothetical protein
MCLILHTVSARTLPLSIIDKSDVCMRKFRIDGKSIWIFKVFAIEKISKGLGTPETGPGLTDWLSKAKFMIHFNTWSQYYAF